MPAMRTGNPLQTQKITADQTITWSTPSNGATKIPSVVPAGKPDRASASASPQNAVSLVTEYPVRIHDEPTRKRASTVRCWAYSR